MTGVEGRTPPVVAAKRELLPVALLGAAAGAAWV
jgi:hypothetical protein